MAKRKYVLLFDYLIGGLGALGCFVGIGISADMGKSWWLNNTLGLIALVMCLALSVSALSQLNEIERIEREERRRRRLRAFLPPGPDE